MRAVLEAYGDTERQVWVADSFQGLTDFREAHGISDPMEWVDWTGVWWQRSAPES